MNKLRNKPIGQIVAENLNAARVFEAHDMDFCCHGAQTLENACKARHINVKQIESELSALIQSPPQEHSDLNIMGLNELTRHIVTVHHAYTKKMLPVIGKHLDTVVRVHSANHPILFDIKKKFLSLQEELEPHLEKEEKKIFPYIDALAEDISPSSGDFCKISQAIVMLKQEHECAGKIFDDINNLAQGYKAPADACNTYRLVLRELQELEQDLHIHIAQENYLLFPKAIKREQERLQKC